MTPLRDDLEYNLDLDCKIKLSENETFEVLNMDPEKQMCMVDVNGAPVDLFGIIRQLIGYISPSLDVMWIGSSGSDGWCIDEDNITLSNESLDLLSSRFPTSLNMTRIADTGCSSVWWSATQFRVSFSTRLLFWVWNHCDVWIMWPISCLLFPCFSISFSHCLFF